MKAEAGNCLNHGQLAGQTGEGTPANCSSRQILMGNLVLKISSSAPRGNRTSKDSGPRLHQENAYNRSSLALSPYDIPFQNVHPAAPFIPARDRTPSLVRGSNMFRGLDSHLKSRRKGSTVFSLFLHFFFIAAVLWLVTMAHGPALQTTEMTVAPIQFTLYDPPPPPVMQVAKLQGGGGGGGAHHLIAPSRGELPKVAKVQLLPPMLPRIISPKLPVEPTAQVRLPQESALPKLGVPDSPQVAMASQGEGSSNGFGLGLGVGIGSGHGAGQGPGSNGGYGGGLMNVGGGVSAPQVIHSVEPQFTAQARSANYQGVVAVQLIVDSQGFPQNVRVVRHLGMGLDEEAIDAVKQYRFRPAIYQGHPVSVQMVVDVEFRLD